MESRCSRKVKYTWDSSADVSPNKIVRYSDIREPNDSMCSCRGEQDSKPQSARSSFMKGLPQKNAVLDSSGTPVKGKYDIETEHPGGTAHSLCNSYSFGNWTQKQTVPSLRKSLPPKSLCQVQIPETVSALSSVDHLGQTCSSTASCFPSPDASGDSSLEDSSSDTRKSRMRNQASPALFMRSLKDVLGSAFSSRVKRTEPSLGRGRYSLQRTDFSRSRDSSSHSGSSFSSDVQELENGQGVHGKQLARNNCTFGAIGNDSYNGYEEGLLTSKVLYPVSLNSDNLSFRTRQSRYSDPVIYQTSRECRRMETSVPSRFSESRHPSLLKKYNNERTSVSPTASRGRYSDPRSSGDTAHIAVSKCRNTEPEDHSPTGARQHILITGNTLRSNTNNDNGTCLSRESRHSDGELSFHASSKWNNPSDPTVYPSTRLSIHSDATDYLTSRKSRWSDPVVQPFVEKQSINTEVYLVPRDERPGSTAAQPSLSLYNRQNNTATCVRTNGCSEPEDYPGFEKSRPGDGALLQASRDSKCTYPGVFASSQKIQQSNTLEYPKSRESQPHVIDYSTALNETQNSTMGTSSALVESFSTDLEKQEPACDVTDEMCNEASRLVFVDENDSEEDDKKELDLSAGSDFSDVDDVIPFANLSQDEFIQANGGVQEPVSEVKYPEPYFLTSWLKYSRHSTSTPVQPRIMARRTLYNSATKNSTLNTSSSNNYSSLSDGWCCGSNSFKDASVSNDFATSFNEEPDVQISEYEQCAPDYLREMESHEPSAKLPSWMSEGFIDTHCHLDMLYNKLPFTGTFAKFREVYRSTFPKQFQGCIADFCNPRLSMKFPWENMLREDMVWGAFGCHPHFARFYNEFHERELLQAMRHPKTIAFGEMGLDYSHKCSTEISLQHKVFERQLELAVGLRKPLVIHCRDADEDLLKIMKKAVPRDYKIHRHCFTGSFNVIEPFLDAFPNMAVGFTALLTYPSAYEARDAALKIPLERIIVETDAPYFLPKQVHKREIAFAHPGLAMHTVSEIARIKELPPISVLAVVRQNTHQLYNL